MLNNSTPTRDNAHPRPASTIVERHRDAYARSATRVARPGLWAKLRPWLAAVALGLAIGASATWAVSTQFSPLAGAVAVRNGIVVDELDGARYFLVTGWAVPLPKAPGQP